MKENVIGDLFSQYRALSLLCYIYSCKSMFLIIYSFVLSLSSQQQPKSGLINLTLTRKETNFVLNALNNFIHTYMRSCHPWRWSLGRTTAHMGAIMLQTC